MRLLLARHAESVWNEVRRFQGGIDVELSARGRRQAQALGRALAAYRPAAAYVSPLARARHTAEIALAGTGARIVTVPELRELSLGEWEGCFSEEIRARAGDPYAAWVRAPLDCPPPGSEPLEGVRRRVLAALAAIAAEHRDGEDVLVVAHGGVISVYACHLLGCSLNGLWRLRVDNASLTVAQPPRLVTLNDTRHLTDGLAPHPRIVGPSRPSGRGRAPALPAQQAEGEEAEGAVEAPSDGGWGAKPPSG